MLSFQFDLRPFGYVWMKVACATFFLVIFPFKNMMAKKNVNERLLWFDCKTIIMWWRLRSWNWSEMGKTKMKYRAGTERKWIKNANKLKNATTRHKQRARVQKNQSLILDQRQLVNVAITVLKMLFAYLFCCFKFPLSLSFTLLHFFLLVIYTRTLDWLIHIDLRNTDCFI